MALSDGLVGYWSPWLGSSGYTLLDRTRYANHGTLTNMDAGTDWLGASILGRSGWYLDFDGSNDRTVNTSNSIYTFGTRNFSFGGWFYLNATTGSYGPLITTWGNSSNAFSGRWFLGMFDTRVRVFDSVGNIAITYTPTTAVWNHYVVSKMSGVVTLYVDGISQGTYTGANQNWSTDGAVSIGGTSNGFANMRCAEAFASRNGLTEAEVRELYRLGPGWYQPYQRKRYAFVGGVTFNRRRRILCGDYS